MIWNDRKFYFEITSTPVCKWTFTKWTKNQSDQKIEKKLPNIWKYSQNWSQNIKAKIESVQNTQLLLMLK
jgi:hypothetical protein